MAADGHELRGAGNPFDIKGVIIKALLDVDENLGLVHGDVGEEYQRERLL